ncbi:MAG: tol-pal system protein YbgF, partial [Moorella sp. (in: Bacteria)]|nr:tol-pal system protein YbgF [Moorella sp. (in: firmicutes)]
LMGGGNYTAAGQTPGTPYDNNVSRPPMAGSAPAPSGAAPGVQAQVPGAPAQGETPYINLDDDPVQNTMPSMKTLGVLRQSESGDQAQTDIRQPPSQTVYPDASAEIANDPVGLYERSFSFLRDRNYDQAETGFADFLNRFPGHDLAPNAKYWLGETYYVRNNFERAARIFAEAYQQYPQGPKGPDNLLKLAMSLAGLGKTEDACVTFGQLQKEYPSGAIPVLMRAEKEMEKLGC